MKKFTTSHRFKLSYLFIIFILFSCVLVNAQDKKSPDQTKDWTIVATYTIPGKASGLAWDGTYIYFGIYGSNGDHVYQFDPATGINQELFINPTISDTYGMTYDGSNLWITDHVLSSSVPAYALQLDFSGNVVSQFNLPDHYMSGIAYDNGDYWVATYYPDPGTIYKVDGSGNILNQINSPEQQPWDVCMQDNDLWVADYNSNMLYKIDQTGTILENHACENIKPSGVVYDGQYLWYVDGQLSSNSTLYKVDLAGGGTPAIELPLTAYNYGNVAVGDSAVWSCTVNNIGTADLEISNLVIQNAVPIFVYEGFPIVIGPGNSTQIDFIYKPTESGSLSTTVTIQSNDPVNPDVDVTLTGEAVYGGPHINVLQTSHDYGTIRNMASKKWEMHVINDGNQTLTISDITIDIPNFYLDPNITFPININVLEDRPIGIWFFPDEATNFSAMATILHNDPTQDSIEVSLTGNAYDDTFPMGFNFWSYNINTSLDNSVKAITPIKDVNADGVSDVIVCSEDDYIRCFNGNSDGLADIIWENEAGTIYAQNDITTIPDINGDGFDDVIAGLAWGVRAVKALSGKTGEQLWIYDTHVYGDGGWVYQVFAKYDYNGDGTPDVLAATGNDSNNLGPKRIFCLDGTDGSVLWESYTDGPNFGVIGVEDFTGDNLPDVIAGASNVNETEGHVYGIDGLDGTITFDFPVAGTSVWALEQLDDANGDGVKDVVAGDFAGHYYFIDPVTGSYFQSGSMGNNILLRIERLDDVNGDGYADISIASSGTNCVVIDGHTAGNVWLTSLADKCWNIDRIEDVTGDGINDLIAGTLYSSNFAYFIDGTNGNILYSYNYGEAVDGIGAIPDINGDGSWEMVVGGRNGTLTCLSGGLSALTVLADFTADTTFGYIPLTVNFTDLSSGSINSWEWDFDNDGTIDSYDQNPEYTYTESGIYTVKLTVSDGISTNTMVKNDYITADTTTNINEINFNQTCEAFPNPFSDKITFKIPNQKNGDVPVLTIFNQQGQKIIHLNTVAMEAGNYIFEWYGQNQTGREVQQGIYYAHIQYGNISEIHKLILSK